MSTIQQLLTNHIDIWTAADNESKSGRGRASGKAASVYGIKKLRELILELAVRGKLVPQDPKDEQASELLKRVQAKKEQTTNIRKIKKPVSTDAISDDEKPFMLPIGWAWTRFGDIVNICTGKLDANAAVDTGNYPFFTCSQTPSRIDSYSFDTSAVLLAGNGDFNVKYYQGKFDAYQRTYVIEPIDIDLKFCFLMVLAQIKTITKNNRGSAVPYLKIGDLTTPVFALPSLREQHRIVAKVDALLALCDQLEAQHSYAGDAHEKLVNHLLGTLAQSQCAADFNASWQRIAAHFDTLFTTETSIDALKQTLLQLAVMGKLATQDANDEPASELPNRIEAEKLKLMAEGKIKKNIPLAPIADEHQPFSLPLGWTWLRLADLMPQFQNGVSSRGDADGEAVVVLRLADIKDRRIVLDDPRELLISPSLIDKYRLLKNDILIVRVNGSADLVGGFIVCEEDTDGIYCDHFIRMKVSQDIINSRFLGLIGSSALIRKKINDLFITTAGQKTVNQGHISSLLIPVPSIAEQHRIVAKIDEMMEMCGELRNSITDANQRQKKLADVLVEHAVVG